MGLSPQSIRSNVLIQMNGEYVKKEVILTLSEGWNDKQLSYFRKMVQIIITFFLKHYQSL